MLLRGLKTGKSLLKIKWEIKTLRTDNGTEFCNSDFDALCVEHGIRRHKNVPYTPQHNGVAERMNRTLLDRVRAILVTSGLPNYFGVRHL